MIKNVLSSIEGVGLYGVISVALFLAVFVGVVFWVLHLRQSDVDACSRLPLEDDRDAEEDGQPEPSSEDSHE